MESTLSLAPCLRLDSLGDPSRIPKGLYRDTLRVMLRWPVLFIVLPVVLYLPGSLLGLLRPPRPMASPFTSASAPIDVLIMPLLAALQIVAMREILAGRGPRARSVLTSGLLLWGPLFVINLHLGARVYLGLQLLVLPGLFLMVYFAFGAHVAVFEGRREKSALFYNERYTRGNVARIILSMGGVVLVFGGPLALLMILLGALLEGPWWAPAVAAAPLNVLWSAANVASTLLYVNCRQRVGAAGERLVASGPLVPIQ